MSGCVKLRIVRIPSILTRKGSDEKGHIKAERKEMLMHTFQPSEFWSRRDGIVTRICISGTSRQEDLVIANVDAIWPPAV